MKKILLLLLMAVSGLFVTTFAHAQSAQPEGAWMLESAVVNRQENGLNEQVHVFTAAEISARPIPTSFEFAGGSVSFTAQGKTVQSDYSFERGQLIFGPSGSRSASMAWIEGDALLIIVSEYAQSDFSGNELRLTYRKNN
jgi:hypothetical protein